jgi:hypothetical protein
MVIVVNTLELAKPVDAHLIQMVEREFLPRMRACPGFASFMLISNSELEALVIVSYDDRHAMAEIGRSVAGPWFTEHVRPYLSGEGRRTVGELLCRS